MEKLVYYFDALVVAIAFSATIVGLVILIKEMI